VWSACVTFDLVVCLRKACLSLVIPYLAPVCLEMVLFPQVLCRCDHCLLHLFCDHLILFDCVLDLLICLLFPLINSQNCLCFVSTFSDA